MDMASTRWRTCLRHVEILLDAFGVMCGHVRRTANACPKCMCDDRTPACGMLYAASTRGKE